MRRAELEATQLLIEREVGQLALQRDERVRQGTAGRSTQTLLNRMNVRRRKIRQLLSVWEAWQAFMLPVGADVQSVEAENVYAGIHPWEPATMAGAVTKDMLHLAMYKAQSELKRTEEELVFLGVDARILLARYQHQQQVL